MIEKQTVQVAAVRGTISDAAITLAAVDPCYCCTERCAVIDRNSNKKILTGDDLIRLSQEKTEKLKVKSSEFIEKTSSTNSKL